MKVNLTSSLATYKSNPVRLFIATLFKPFFCTLVLLLLSSTSVYSEILNAHSWSDQTFQQAKQDNKLVLLDLGAEWCQFCKKMQSTTYSDPAVISTLNENYLVIKVDEKDIPSLAKKYQNDGHPTTVIFSSDGTQILKRSGYIKPQWMNWMLQAVALKPNAEAHL